MMNKKLLGIIIMTAILFLLTPMSAISATVEDEEPTPAPSIIPQSKFVITLGENEEVIWTADYAIRDDDVAYVTMQTTVESGELEGLPMSPPQPLGIWDSVKQTITAKNWWGWPLFTAVARALVRYTNWCICTHIIDICWARGWVWRYDADYGNSYTEGVGYSYGKVTWDVYFIDYLIRRTPFIHVWAKSICNGDPTGGGYLEWES